ncbi:hypothetical protein J1614_009008 [Plenodomus biglobosus]|nr:hypothetical protein J1614_009008 [Plenodomus biglobosus]
MLVSQMRHLAGRSSVKRCQIKCRRNLDSGYTNPCYIRPWEGDDLLEMTSFPQDRQFSFYHHTLTLPFGSPLSKHGHHTNTQQTEFNDIQLAKLLHHLRTVHLRYPFPVVVHPMPVRDDVAQIALAFKLA